MALVSIGDTRERVEFEMFRWLIREGYSPVSPNPRPIGPVQKLVTTSSVREMGLHRGFQTA